MDEEKDNSRVLRPDKFDNDIEVVLNAARISGKIVKYDYQRIDNELAKLSVISNFCTETIPISLNIAKQD